MDPILLLLRWGHILAALVLMGGLTFVRFALEPALEQVDAETRAGIHERIRRRWLPWVIGGITLLLASGLANFLLFNSRVRAEGWEEGTWMRQTGYHALFGGKMLLAFAAFYLASGLVGRGAGTQWIRNDRSKWLSVTLGLLLGVVLVSGWMRQLHTGANTVDGGVGLSVGPGSDDEGGGASDRYRDGRAGAAFRGPPGGGSAPEGSADPAPLQPPPAGADPATADPAPAKPLPVDAANPPPPGPPAENAPPTPPSR
ncbi:MAG: hypothetical protein ACKOTB_11725 [Planctomycetia bacterium]